MEDLLTPQICMDVDDTPLEVGKEDSNDRNSEAGEPDFDDDEKVKKLLEMEFTDPSQVPEQLTNFELEARKNVFAVGEPAVQYHRLHCTACNVHLGSAPIGHFNRYIHPVLKVLLCKQCYEFYCSGDFDKDEDGSEMYCRWCGQGGKVMCCAQCAYVFCQKCVRQNLGKKTLEIIKDSDDWMCFGCNPTQLINLKIICTSLYDFVQEEVRLARALNNVERLKLDHSVCCQKTKSKRKREDDASYNPKLEWEEQVKPAKKMSVLKQTLMRPISPIGGTVKDWGLQDGEDEVVCTPDLPSLLEDDDKIPHLSPLTLPPLIQLSQPKGAAFNNRATGSKYTPRPNVPFQKPPNPESKKIYSLAPKPPVLICTNRPSMPSNMQRGNNNFVRLQNPAIRFVSAVSNRPAAPILNSSPAHIVPGLRHEWFEKAESVVSTITGNLSTTLVFLTKEQKAAQTVEQLATVHNQLQELLSTSVNSLIQVRKNLRTEFLGDLNKLRFTESPNLFVNNKLHKSVSFDTSITGKEDDDDVILVNSEKPPKSNIITTPNQTDGFPKRPYLKVRTVSQLLSVPSECITIPDDPPPEKGTPDDDVIAVYDKDPLSIDLDAENETTQIAQQQGADEDKRIDIEDENYDEATFLLIKNALTESKIDQIVQENMKYYNMDINQEELKKILSVRVVLGTNYSFYLPKHRLKTTNLFPNETANVTTDMELTTEQTEINCLRTEEIENEDIQINCPVVIEENTNTENSEVVDELNINGEKDHPETERNISEENEICPASSENNVEKELNEILSNESPLNEDKDKVSDEEIKRRDSASPQQHNSTIGYSDEEKSEEVAEGEIDDESCKDTVSESGDMSTMDGENATPTESNETLNEKSVSFDEQTNDDTVDLPADKAGDTLKNDFSTDPVTTDSGIDVDSK